MSAARFPITPCGDDALRVVCGAGPVRHALAHHLRDGGVWIDVVPGKADVTVIFDPHPGAQAHFNGILNAQLERVEPRAGAEGRLHVLPARFGGADGLDLETIAASLALTPDALIANVLETELMVDLIGFTPGFAYCTGLSDTLQVSRLASPRVRVPAGSIGMITGQMGFYALEGPGGWPLIGRITTPLFDPSADEPFSLAPGDRVRLVREAA